MDDELGLLTSLKRLLETHGYVAAVAVGGAAALTQLAENRYDLLVLDLGMPGIGGAAVLDFTIERYLDMAVIVISGTTSVVEATAAMRRGAIDYLRKPFGPDELLASIANATRKLQLERANRLMRDRVDVSERLHRFLVNNSPDLIFMLDVEGRFSYLNKRVKALLGFETDALVKQPLACLVAPPDRDKVATLLRRLAAGATEPQLAEWHFLRQEAFHHDRPTLDLFVIAEVTAFPIISGNGSESRFTGSYLVARDVTSRQRAEEALRQASARLEHVVSASPAVIYSRDPYSSRPLNFISSNVNDLLGYRAEELLADVHLWEHLVHPEDRVRFKHSQNCEDEYVQTSCEYRLRHRDGGWRWIRDTVRLIRDSEGYPVELVGSWLDNTEAQLLSEQLSHQANHDSLTELPNRRAFERRLQQALECSRAQNVEHALFYLDLDQFKIINDTCGHMAGDALLRQLSRILQARVRRQDMLARLGGDEFGVLMEYCSLQDAMRLANSLCKRGQRFSLCLGRQNLPCGGKHRRGVDQRRQREFRQRTQRRRQRLLRRQGRRSQPRAPIPTTISSFPAAKVKCTGWRASTKRWKRTVSSSPSSRSCLPWVGPMAITTNCCCAWRTRSGNWCCRAISRRPPEHYHLAVKLDHWVVSTALDWLSDNPDHLRSLSLCSINLSGLSLGDVPLLDYLVERLKHRRNLSGKLCFEVTETAAIANFNNALHFIGTLKSIGCRFALDDFGSGLSSFAYLKKLPVDFLKIDGVFVEDIANDPVSLAMVNSINEVGHLMGMETIAEFVKNDQILAKLRAIGVNYAQGYGVGKPRPLAELVACTELWKCPRVPPNRL